MVVCFVVMVSVERTGALEALFLFRTSFLFGLSFEEEAVEEAVEEAEGGANRNIFAKEA